MKGKLSIVLLSLVAACLLTSGGYGYWKQELTIRGHITIVEPKLKQVPVAEVLNTTPTEGINMEVPVEIKEPMEVSPEIIEEQQENPENNPEDTPEKENDPVQDIDLETNLETSTKTDSDIETDQESQTGDSMPLGDGRSDS